MNAKKIWSGIACFVLLISTLFFYRKGDDPSVKLDKWGSILSVERRFMNSLGMCFVPVKIGSGREVLFSVWETRVKDYAEYASSVEGVDVAADVTYKSLPITPTPTCPVVNVSWNHAKAFADWLTIKEHAAGLLPKNAAYRLPTDEEWSWAVGIGHYERWEEPVAVKDREALYEKTFLTLTFEQVMLDQHLQKLSRKRKQFGVVIDNETDATRIRGFPSIKPRDVTVVDEPPYDGPTTAQQMAMVGASQAELERKQRFRIYEWGRQLPPPDDSGNLWDATAMKVFGMPKVTHGNSEMSEYWDGYPATAPVGSFRRNKHGIYDLSGNVQEWCDDLWAEDSEERVARGDSWAGGIAPMHRRRSYEGSTRSPLIGFRLVLVVE